MDHIVHLKLIKYNNHTSIGKKTNLQKNSSLTPFKLYEVGMHNILLS